eukprot:gnl/MRDRNA2_/MRDRNA2_155584_c0_seq1.p1 gnl/MRDRNA2_/MRDRNA2_155584_c0~~gnl/MRDRNA2_/MRDRNA2_155584_c0_seq1.p1  ORF type:complete len:453 (+),score=68.82 gnl/MRDRNA2_/MRDRNA2_155584_c0_seq1:78-1436(+)
MALGKLSCLWSLAGLQCASSSAAGAALAQSNRWRVVNLEPVTYGWAIAELEFYSDAFCSPETKLGGQSFYNETDPTNTWVPISSGFRDSRRPERAFDGRSWTEWRAQCHVCAAEEAYLGIELEEEYSVKCLRIWQWGEREYGTSQVALEYWKGVGNDYSAAKWVVATKYGGVRSGGYSQLYLIPCEPLEIPSGGAREVTNDGYYPSTATYSCGGINFLGGDEVRECQQDGAWTGEEPRCWAPFELVSIAAGCLGFEFLIVLTYFLLVISRKPPRLNATTFIPPEHLGKWTSDAMSNFQDEQDMLCCVACCPICRIADTWHTAGLLFYPWGVILNSFIVCIPCMGMIFRRMIRDRFGIRDHWYNDVVMWCCFLPCAAAQEAKHVDTMVTIADEEVDVQRQSEAARNNTGKDGSKTSGDRERTGSKTSDQAGSKERGGTGSKERRGSTDSKDRA